MDGPWPRVVATPTARLHALVWEPAERRVPDLLLVHGLASNARLWDGVAERFRDRGHRVVAVDQRGHGLSSAADVGYDFTTLTADLVAVMDALGLDRPVVAGQSWGGNVVLELAARYPQRVAGIVCVDGGLIELGDAFARWEDVRAALAPPRLDGLALDRVEGSLRRRHPTWTDTAVRGQLANFAVRPDGTVVPHLSRDRHLTILRHLWRHRPSRRLGEVTAPVLLLPVRGSGHPSDEAAVDRALATLARGRVHWFEGDHDIHAEDPDGVVAVVAGAIDDGFLATAHPSRGTAVEPPRRSAPNPPRPRSGPT